MSMEDVLAFGASLFEGHRIRFRHSTEEDYELLQSWWLDPQVMVLQSTNAVSLRSRESIIAMFKTWSQISDSGFGYSIVRKQDNKLIGHIALWGITAKDRCASLGILIDKSVWGLGYGTEALRMALHYGFSELNLHRIQLEVSASNERAIHSYRKAGFREEGRRRQSFFRNGRWQDQVQMAILAEEFLSASKPRENQDRSRSVPGENGQA
ncbi:MAG TPA: GNAT family protein [Chthoniobacterales bacterium]|nr:GNAT family protein [Chthoniobacterales bacterium]